MVRCFNNKIKKLAMFLQFIASCGSITFGVLLYLTGYLTMNNKTFTGTKVLKKLELDYGEIPLWISYASYAAGGAGFFGLIAAKTKKWYTATLYLLLAVGAGLLCMYVSAMSISFEQDRTAEICKNSDEGKIILEQW